MQIEIHKTINGNNDLFTAITTDGFMVIDNSTEVPMAIYTESLQEMYEFLGNIGQNDLNISTRRIDGTDRYSNLVEYEFIDVFETRH